MLVLLRVALHKNVNFGPKCKKLAHNSSSWVSYVGWSIFLLLLVGNNFRANGQEVDSTQVLIPVDSLVSADSVSLADSVLVDGELIPQDSVQSDSLQAQPTGDIATTVFYQSRDSITMNMRTKAVDLYGASNIDYKPIGLQAEKISIDWNNNIIEARGVPDSTGTEIGKPVFKNGAETYETNNIRYSFKTEKAVISGLVTQQGEGIIHGERVFKNEDDELFIPFTKYTTCNLEHPHFYIAARNVKAIPENKLVTGPFNMVVNDVPTPLGFFFGMFPEQSTRSSGIIVPSYGEQQLRGFYLENGGYYFAINDYINLETTGSIYSRGGFGVNLRSMYRKRYKYNGNFQFNYTKQNFPDDSETGESVSKDFRLAWQHSPQTRGTGRFSASVNAATSSYNQNNVLQDINDQVRTTLSSSVNYSKSFTGTPISFGANARFNQNVQTKKVDLLLPELSANVANLYPFRSKTGASRTWYEKLTVRYAMNATNKITNQVSADSIAPFDLQTLPKLIENANRGVRHVVPLATSIKALRFFTLSPSISYEELWYDSKLEYSWNAQDNQVETDTIPGFNRVFSYGASASLNTILYGTYFLNREYGIQAIRHLMTPSISYSYRPDFSDPRFGYYQEVQSNENGDTSLLRRYAGYVYGQPGAGETSALSFSLTNSLEMKVRSRKDTTGKAEKIVVLRNFGLSTSYNFAQDSFNLSRINIRATTTLFNNKEIFGGSAQTRATTFNISGNIDPYVYILDSIDNSNPDSPVVYQRRVNEFAWNKGRGIGQFQTLVLSFRTGLSAKERKKGDRGYNEYTSQRLQEYRDRLQSGTLSYHEEAIIQSILDHPEYFVNFNVPWSINISYSLNFRKQGFRESDVTQTLQFNGDVSLTPKWKLTYNSGYDLKEKEFTQTRLGLSRDLHCWELTFSWVPFGRYTSYDFTIRAKASLLQDLQLNRRRGFIDNL